MLNWVFNLISLFYGQTRQILHKKQNSGELLTKEESFNHLISFFN